MMSGRIDKISAIARIDLTSDEKKRFEKDLDNILDSFDRIESIDTSRIEPTFQPVEVKNIKRQDNIEESLERSEALKNSKHTQDGYFKGPKAM